MPGFEFAMKLGVTTLELDVVATRDAVVVISHDPALNPDITRDRSGNFLTHPGPNIIDLTIEQLAQYDVGRINPSSQYANERQSMQALLDLGVDGLVTDRPDIALELLRDRKVTW